MKILVLERMTAWFFTLSLVLLLFTGSIALAVNSQWLYERGMEKYGVSRTTGLAWAELEKAAAGLIRYFNSDEEHIRLTVTKDGQPFELFNQREVAHLKDVKDLVRLDYRVLLITSIYALAFIAVSLLKRRELLARSLIRGSGLTLALILALGTAALLDFDRFFLRFHLLSFTNELWMLDPSRDYLIMMFPQGFWFDATVFVAVATVTGAVVLGGVGLFLARRWQGSARQFRF